MTNNLNGLSSSMQKATSLAIAVLLFAIAQHLPAQNKSERTTNLSSYCTAQIQSESWKSAFSWRENVWTTTFWIGQSSLNSVPGSSCNTKSAWERNWVRSYGGVDHPTKRCGFRPAAFLPKHNSFYVALPYNDLTNPKEAARWIPWWKPGLGRWTSQLKGRWLAIERNGRTAYAQWKDVGPWVTHDPAYVFAGKKHRGKAGLDVSPAVRDYLGLRGGCGYTRWRFVEDHEVPVGPWLDYGDVRQKIIAAREQYALKANQIAKQNQNNEYAHKQRFIALKKSTNTESLSD